MLDPEQALAYVQSHPKVALVGLSPKPERPAYVVASYLQNHGLEIIPIHPKAEEVLGLKVRASLAELEPGEVDWLDLFVSPSRLMDLWPEIKRLRPGLVWCQLGVVDPTFNQLLEDEGIPYIADRCPKIEWSRLE